MVAWRTDVDSAQLMKCTVATEVEDADAEGRHQTQRTQDEMEIRKKKMQRRLASFRYILL